MTTDADVIAWRDARAFARRTRRIADKAEADLAKIESRLAARMAASLGAGDEDDEPASPPIVADAATDDNDDDIDRDFERQADDDTGEWHSHQVPMGRAS